MSRSVPRRGVGVIVGASSGVGAALLSLAVKSYDVYAAARRPISVPPGARRRVYPVVCDIRDPGSVEALFDLVGDQAVDFVVHCAAVGYYAPLSANYSRYWADIVHTNVCGTLHVLSGVYRRRDCCRHLICLGSIAAFRPSPTTGNIAYGASKAAVTALIRDFRSMLRAEANMMKVTLVSPGFIGDTDFGRRFFESEPSKRVDLYGSFESLAAVDVARAIYNVIQTPGNLEYSEMILAPLEQPT